MAAAIIVAAIVVGGAALLWPRSSQVIAGQTHEATHPAPTASEEGSARPEPVDAAVVSPDAGTIGSTPQTSLAEAAGSAGDTRDGAAALGAPRDAVEVSEVIGSDSTLGGCHDSYGSAGQCLPVIPPSLAQHAADMSAAGLDPSTMPHRWSCQELRLTFPDGIAVRVTGVDPDALDDDSDGTACEPDG